MIFNDTDIKFENITWKQFEELCFDLLAQFHFNSIVWRKGGADKGRDIEASLIISNELVGSYHENWFIECKHCDTGLSINLLSDKIEWAKAERVNHFLLITNSYLTQSAREWLTKIEKGVGFRVHMIEGKRLKQILVSHPDLILKYFFNDYTLLVRDMLRQWILHDILPESKALYKLSKGLDPNKLNINELAFLLFVYSELGEAVEKFCYDEDIKKFSSNFLLSATVKSSNFQSPVVSKEEIEMFDLRYNRYTYSKQVSKQLDNDFIIIHLFEKIPEGGTVEIFMKRKNKRLEVRVGLQKK